MKRLIHLLLLLTVCLSSSSAFTLSSEAQISLLTCEPGKQVYERFGHSALRVKDPVNQFDVTFHYGIFDFNTEWFIAKFIKGYTYYEMGALPTIHFFNSYAYRNSTVHEQVLNLTPEGKQHLYDALEENYQPENRTYLYNFVYDNCSTRPFEIIERNCGSTLTFELKDNVTTFRHIIEKYVGKDNWLRFGIDILIGSEADKQENSVATLGFPLYAKDLISTGTILLNDSVSTPLVAAENTPVVAKPESPERQPVFPPMSLFALILSLIIWASWYEQRKKRYFIAIDAILFITVGLLGVIITYLSYFSLHPLVHDNYNLLWANPLHLLYGIAILIKPMRKPARYISLFIGLLTLGTFGVLISNIQVMNPAFGLIAAMLLTRSITYFIYFNRKNTFSK